MLALDVSSGAHAIAAGAAEVFGVEVHGHGGGG